MKDTQEDSQSEDKNANIDAKSPRVAAQGQSSIQGPLVGGNLTQDTGAEEVPSATASNISSLPINSPQDIDDYIANHPAYFQVEQKSDYPTPLPHWSYTPPPHREASGTEKPKDHVVPAFNPYLAWSSEEFYKSVNEPKIDIKHGKPIEPVVSSTPEPTIATQVDPVAASTAATPPTINNETSAKPIDETKS